MGRDIFSSYRIAERSYISLIKRDIHRLLKEADYSDRKTGEVDIIVSELTSNLIKHTNDGGHILFKLTDNEEEKYFEIFCFDNGPGTNEIQSMLKDGASSSNTLGQGLGAINRLSDEFQIYSGKNWGTIAYSRKYKNEPKRFLSLPLCIKALQEPFEGEKVCGDGYAILKTDNEVRIFLGDGLGHGMYAYEAVQEAIAAFNSCTECSAVEILRDMHGKTKKTRGLVGTVAVMDLDAKKWRIAGVGNISTRIYKGLEYRNFMPHNGIIGLNMPNSMNDYEMELEGYQTIIMSSDGIKTKWDLSQYASILKYDPSIIAAAIYKDHARNTDDVTVLVGKTKF